MAQVTVNTPPPLPADPDSLVEALLYSVSHDLRSPLLTLSLAGELIAESLGDRLREEPSSSGVIALDALQHGTRDLERMLQALTSVSRARRRPLEQSRAPLRLLLGGHLVISDAGDLGSRQVGVDPIAIREIIDAVCGEDPAEIAVSLDDTYALLRLPLDASLAEVRGGPLVTLAQSLQLHAGTLVETLAAAEVVLVRCGGRAEIADDGVRLWLPLVQPSGSVDPGGEP
jgi:signal transduction histidine kinase